MKIMRCITDMLGSNMYIVIEEGRAIVIDPCRNTEMPDKIMPELILLTHEHYDHISGVNAWKKKYKVPVLCSKKCNERIQSEKKNMARYFEAFCGLQIGLDNRIPDDFDPSYECEADEVFENDYDFIWMGHSIRLILLPGHSPGSIGILIDNNLFSGDCIFINQETTLKFPGGSEKEWHNISLPKIRSLPEDTFVYPGHFECFRLIEWKEYGKDW